MAISDQRAHACLAAALLTLGCGADDPANPGGASGAAAVAGASGAANGAGTASSSAGSDSAAAAGAPTNGGATSQLAGAGTGGVAASGAGTASQALAGTGASAGTAGAPASNAGASSGGAGGAPSVVDPALIDDFEDGDSSIVSLGERLGQWSSYNDGTTGAVQTPAAGASLTGDSPGAGASTLAAHTSGSGFADWGAGIQMDFQNPGNGASSRLPYDASAYAGVQFYAKGTGDIRLELAVPTTTDAAAGGTCAENCFDTHGRRLELSADWTLVTVPFAALSQEGWGAEAAFTPGALLGLAFKARVPTDGTADFDFWIDDLRFATESEVSGVSNDPDNTGPDTNEAHEPTTEAGQCSDQGGYENGNGSVTYYYFDQGSAEVNCSYAITGRNPDTVAHIATGNGQYFGAMNTADYNDSAVCGACVEVTRDGGRSVVITIVDQCPIDTNPKCGQGHIDLSTAAFDQVGNRGGEGYLGQGNGGDTGSISWRYVACPVQETISFKLKEPTEVNWNQLLVQGHTYPIASVEINGKQATRQSYNYWEPPDGDMGPEPFDVRVTDVNGGVITASVPREAGDIDSGVQLTCQ